MPRKVASHRRRKRPYWRVTAQYPFGQYSDEEMERLAGKLSVGSGVGFGQRDMDWEFKTGPAAKRAAKRLAKKRKVSVELQKWADQDDVDPIDSYMVK